MNGTTNFDNVIDNYLNPTVNEKANITLDDTGAPVIQTRGGGYRRLNAREKQTFGNEINAAMQERGMGKSVETSVPSTNTPTAAPPTQPSVTNINVDSPDPGAMFDGIGGIFAQAGRDANTAAANADAIRRGVPVPAPTPPQANISDFPEQPTPDTSTIAQAPAPTPKPAPAPVGLPPGYARPDNVKPAPVPTPKPAEPVGTGTVLKPPPGGFPKAPNPTNTATQAAAAMQQQGGGTLAATQPGVKGGGMGDLAMGAGLAGAGLYGLSKLIDRPSREERERRR